MYFPVIQGHTGREIISLEMLGHVLILHLWEEFVFHRGSSFNLASMVKAGLIARREGRETRHTVFFTPLDSWSTEEEEHFDFARGIAFWQTKSHAIITDGTVPPDCIERVIPQRGNFG